MSTTGSVTAASAKIDYQIYRTVLGNRDLTDEQIVLIHTRLGQYPAGQKPSVYATKVFSTATEVWAQLSKEIKALDEKIAQDLRLRDDLRIQVESMTQEMEGQNHQLEWLQEEINRLSTQLGDIERQLEAIRPQLAAVENERKTESDAVDQSAAVLEQRKKEKEAHEKEWGKYLYSKAEAIPVIPSLFGQGSISQSAAAIAAESEKKRAHERSLSQILDRKNGLEVSQREYLGTRTARANQHLQLTNQFTEARERLENLNIRIADLTRTIATSQIDRGAKDAQRNQIAIIKTIAGRINLSSDRH